MSRTLQQSIMRMNDMAIVGHYIEAVGRMTAEPGTSEMLVEIAKGIEEQVCTHSSALAAAIIVGICIGIDMQQQDGEHATGPGLSDIQAWADKQASMQEQEERRVLERLYGDWQRSKTKDEQKGEDCK